MSLGFWEAFVIGLGFAAGYAIMAAVGRAILKRLWTEHKVCPRCEGLGLLEKIEE